MMRLKQGPVGAVDAVYFQGDFGRSSKTPPREVAGGGVENPVGLQPLDNIVMAGEEDVSRLSSSAGRTCPRTRAKGLTPGSSGSTGMEIKFMLDIL